MTTVHTTAPSENWDDDFEFQQRTSVSQNPIFDPRVSIASSDWDHDDNSRAPTHTILEDKKNTLLPLADWAEPGPSTPKKCLQPKQVTENWDDDFEDSPRSRAFPSPPKLPGSATRPRRAPIPQTPQTENWDDDFESPPRNHNPRSLETRLLGAESYSSSEDEGDDHLGTHVNDTSDAERDEEDKTVTARSRRAALARLTNKTPPPPVPALPLQLDTNQSYHPRPFPRSPTSSVFSVPRPPSAFTVNSTTHLRPTVSRTSSSNGPASLSPSPPVNRETRERRRLRKKSRPPGVDPIELDTFSPMIPERDGYESNDVDELPDARPQTPPPKPTNVPATPGGSGGGSGTLLSRIGSVKKWGVRRKRASTTPSETLPDLSTKPPTGDADQDQTPRRHSQASSASVPSVDSAAVDECRQQPAPPAKPKRTSVGAPPSSSSNWFFRSGSSTHSNETGLSNRSSNTDLRQNRKASNSSRSQDPSPTKLVKRKSLGFVPLRMGMGFGGNSAVVDDGREKDPKRRVSAHRPISPSPQMSNGSLRRTSESSDSIREGDEDEHSSKEKEGSRGFMGSVRRLSLTNRHKRTKSGVSLSSVMEIEAVFGSPPRDNAVTPKPSARQLPPSKDPLPAVPLLPPIELSPPSPPRHRPKTASGSGQIRLPVSPSDSLIATANSAGTLSAIPSAPTSAEVSPITPAARSMKKAGSPQAASLGRSTVGPSSLPHGPGLTTRRSSLGDLKIPDRISQAQVSLRRDLGMVREFAANVEQLKELQTTYNELVAQVEQILDRHAHAQNQQQQQQQPAEPRAGSPSFLANLTRPKMRKRSNTGTSPPREDPQALSTSPQLSSQEAYKQLAAAFYTINSKYRISWECAELLIELGGGSTPAPPSSSVSAPVIGTDSRKSSANRERAITLSGEESKPPTPIPGAAPSTSSSGPSTIKTTSPNVTSPQSADWKASAGRHDLTQRQLTLLRDMLNNVDSYIPEESSPPTAMSNAHKDWRWGDGMTSTITLPSEDSSLGESVNKKKKRRTGRLGMTGLRDMLRMLKKNQSANSMATPSSSIPTSASSLSVHTSQQDTHLYPHAQIPVQGRPRAKTDSRNDEERIGRAISPSPRPPSLKSKRSPRRPSLAAIFRIGQKHKAPPLPTEHANSSKPNLAEAGIPPRSNSQSSNRSSTGDEDWDQVESSSDVDNNAKSPLGDGTATVRVKGNRHRSPYLQDYNPPPGHRGLVPKRSASASRSSIWGGDHSETSGTTPPNARGTRLSNVNEDVASSPSVPKNGVPRPVSARLASYGSKSQKSGSVRSMPPQPLLPDPKLAMTPENIKPLLENTKEVHVRLNDCITEIRTLLSSYTEP